MHMHACMEIRHWGLGTRLVLPQVLTLVGISLFTPRACARGKVIDRVVVIVNWLSMRCVDTPFLEVVPSPGELVNPWARSSMRTDISLAFEPLPRVGEVDPQVAHTPPRPNRVNPSLVNHTLLLQQRWMYCIMQYIQRCWSRRVWFTRLRLYYSMLLVVFSHIIPWLWHQTYLYRKNINFK